MIVLPIPARHAHLRSFWLTLCGLVGCMAALCGWGWHIRYCVEIAVVAAVALAVLGMILTDFVRPVYLAWNKLAQDVGRCARMALSGICFFIIITATGRCGSRSFHSGSSSTGAMWVRRKTLARESYSSTFDGAAPGTDQKGWIRIYLNWARKSGNLWAVSLLPFLIVLSVIGEENQEAPPSHIYTLF